MLKKIAIAFLILWVIRDVWVYGFAHYGISIGGIGGAIGGTVADFRIWLLVIGIVALHYREKKKATATSAQ